jgi:hypothetical protein
VIVFYGDNELKEIEFIPPGTYITKPDRALSVIHTILNNHPPASYTNKREVVNVLKKAVENGNKAETQSIHIENVKNMLGKDRLFD